MKNDARSIHDLYDRFNARDIDAVLPLLAEDVAWANGMDGGHVHGREAIRKYWTEQWSTIDPHVDPLEIDSSDDREAVVEVRQVVYDLAGKLLLDETVLHVFRIENGFVTRFDIRSASKLSSVVHGP